jgi:site-specific DNA recombinase
VVHEPLIAPQEFDKAQERLREMARRSADRKPRSTPRAYVLRSLIYCGVCNRRMQGTWNNGKPHYRCRYPAEYAETNNRHPKSVYVREGIVIPAVDVWLATLFDDGHVEATIDAMAGSLKSSCRDEASVRRAEPSVGATPGLPATGRLSTQAPTRQRSRSGLLT